jgi:hypothetical protein
MTITNTNGDGNVQRVGTWFFILREKVCTRIFLLREKVGREYLAHCLIDGKGLAPFGRARTFWKGMPLLEGNAQLCLIGEKGRAPFGRACPFWKGMPNFACLIGKGAPLLVRACPKESGIVGN